MKFLKTLLILTSLLGCAHRPATSNSSSQQSPTVRIAAVQFPVVGGVSENDFLNKVEAFIVQAKTGGAKLVIFPELITADVIPRKSELSEAEHMKIIAKELTPKYEKWLLEQAKKHSIQIMGGSSTREEKGQYFNTAIFVTPEGRLLRQDKLFYTPGEKKWGLTPGSTLKVFDTVAGRAVIAICFDSEMPLVSQLLSGQRPEMIMIPSWTGSMSGFNRVNWSAQARAVEHYAYVVKTSTVPEKNSVDPHFGQASVISPQDTGFSTDTIDGKYNKPDIIFADVMMEGLSQKREKTGYYPIKEQALRKEKIKVVKE